MLSATSFTTLRLRGTRPLPSPACGGGSGWGRLACPEDLRDLAGAVITDEQATIGRIGDSQRVREPGREIARLPVLARIRAREHHANDPATGGTADVGAPLGDEGVVRVVRAKLDAVVDDDAVRGRVRREHGDGRSDAGAVAMKTAIGKGRPATRPSRIFAVYHSQQMVRRLCAEIVLAVDGHVCIAGRGAERKTVGIAGAPNDKPGVAPVAVK